MKIAKYFTASGNTININFGFVPDKVFAISALGGTELYYQWHKILAEQETSGQYGMVDAAGTKTAIASADDGFVVYDTETDGVKIPSPLGETTANPDGLISVIAGDASASSATISDWSASVNYSSSGQDRSSSVVGTVVRPPTHNGRVFELITGTGAGTSEPSSWDVVPGTQITDGGSNVFICREEILCRIGGKGITIGSGISTDGELWYIEAETFDEIEYVGDSAEKDPI